MADTTCRAGFVRSLGRAVVPAGAMVGMMIADPDISAEDVDAVDVPATEWLGRCLLVLERLVDSGAVEVDAAQALLTPDSCLLTPAPGASR